jgi:hypothetical protein
MSEAKNSDFVVHIGYAKAASSFIQSSLFSGHHPSFVPFQPDEQKNRTYRKPGLHLFFDRPNQQRGYLPFHFNAAAIRAEISAHPQTSGTIIAISSEDFAGHPFSGGIWAEGILNRIKATVDRPKILITIREQRKMLLSTYADYLDRTGGLASLDRFLSPRGLDQAPAHVVEYYEFSHLIASYQQAFGIENVLVLPMEVITANPTAAFGRICDHCGVARSDAWKLAPQTTNSRDYGVYTVRRMMRRANVWSSPKAANGHAGRNVPGLRGAIRDVLRIAIPKSVSQWVGMRDLRKIEAALRPTIPQDNLRLQASVDDDLQALGYMMPPSSDRS